MPQKEGVAFGVLTEAPTRRRLTMGEKQLGGTKGVYPTSE